MVTEQRVQAILIYFLFSSGYEIDLMQSILEIQSRPKSRRITYSDFINPKWSVAHNKLSEILRRQIPFEVSICRYGLGSDLQKKAIKEYMKKHPNFPQCN